MTYFGKIKIGTNNVKTLKLFNIANLKIRHFSQFYSKFIAHLAGWGTFWTKRIPKEGPNLAKFGKKVP